jgi:hypothetical protein
MLPLQALASRPGVPQVGCRRGLSPQIALASESQGYKFIPQNALYICVAYVEICCSLFGSGVLTDANSDICVMTGL